MYINIETKQLKTESEIRAENPDTSYPVLFPTPDGYAVVFDAPQPTHDQYSEAVVQLAPILTDKGHYQQQWEIIPLTGDELAQAQERKSNDEYNAKYAKIESDFKAFLDLKNIESIGEASALLNSTNVEWQGEAAHAIELWDATWQAFYNNLPLPNLEW